jgi:hypothetical protein
MPANVVTGGGLMTGVGSATLPAMALVGSASNRLELIEIGIFNTTATAHTWNLWKISSAGTPGTALPVTAHDVNDPVTGTIRGVYTSTAPTLGVNLGYTFYIPATIGAGVVRPFTPSGLIIPATAAAGLALMSAAGQICQVDWTFIEI